MKFYDMHINSEEAEKTAEMAKKLGWDGLVFIRKWNGNGKKIESISEQIKKIKSLDASFGVFIETTNANDMQKIIRSIRKNVPIIIVKTYDLNFNRTVLETPEIDVLSGSDIKLNHVMAELASKNNIAIEFNFHDIITSYKKSREHIFINMIENAKFIKKYRSPFIITSGAMNQWDIRSPFDIFSFGRLLGFKDPEIKKAMSDFIVKENRKRLSGKWIAPGIELE